MRVATIVIGVVMLLTANHRAASAEESPVIDKAMKSAMVDSICLFLSQSYVFEDQGSKIASHMRRQLKKGAYAAVSDPEELAAALTNDLQSINNDGHLRVRYEPKLIAMARRDTVEHAPDPERIRAVQNDNFGFHKVERLPGNIGYLDFRSFQSTLIPGAGQTAVAAMQFLAHSRAIIFDIRQNGGGNPEMIQLISTYLFAEEQHLNDLRSRPENFTHQFWTLSYVPGPRMPDTPVYVLTSNRTFSGAEEFAINLKELKRATLVGEATGGGAHAGQGMIINDYFGMFMPTDEAINPISKSNWEGTGVIPHIAVPADSALDVAYMHALETLIDAADDDDERAELAALRATKKAELASVEVPVETLAGYQGTYGIRRVFLEDGSLYFQRDHSLKLKMLPISPTSFILERVGAQVTFLPDDAGVVLGFELIRAPGDTVRAIRTE